MNELAAIEAVDSELASDLDQALERAVLAGDGPAMTRIERKQRINDSAYFILAWGQLEAEINRAAEAAVRTRRASIRWEDRRAWDAHDPDNMRAKFEDRAALVLDRFNATSNAYKRAIRYYGWRNAIAHGTNLATGIDVASTILDLYQIASEIKP